MVPLQYWVSVRKRPQEACITGVPGVSRNKRVLAWSQTKHETTEIPSPRINISFPHHSSLLTAYMPDNTFQTVAKDIRCWQLSFVMTVTATIKLTTSIITIFAPKVLIHKEHVFFSKYKEIHRMILYTTYNKYRVSYILLFERMCEGFCL